MKLELERRDREIRDRLLAHVRDKQDLAIVQAPPGSGKTWLLTEAVALARHHNEHVAIAAQTNAQADDICRRLKAMSAPVGCVRFASRNYATLNLGPHVQWVTETKKLPSTPGVVVATTAKWSAVNSPVFDVLFVEEAWQMSWAHFMPLGQVAGRFILIGDPGQIPPVVSIDPSRWETAPMPPHIPAPQVAKQRFPDALDLRLPATRRLPHDSAELVRPFYEFDFGALALPGARRLIASGSGRTVRDGVIDRLGTGSVAALTIRTPVEGPPLELDRSLAAEAVGIALRMLERQVEIVIDGERGRLEPKHIGLCATHHVMNSELSVGLPASVRDSIRVDTPERWQGLQRPVMVIVHPLSGRTDPTEFDLETGRLCVMASRHQVSLVIVSRDHVSETLRGHLPAARQAVGREDRAGKGLQQNTGFWKTLVDGDRLVA